MASATLAAPEIALARAATESSEPIMPAPQPPTPIRPAAAGRQGQSSGEVPAAPPTIRVSIGRIEVRASEPPAPPRRPIRKSAGISLEAYLRGEAEGV